jgi:hypothetical protein
LNQIIRILHLSTLGRCRRRCDRMSKEKTSKCDSEGGSWNFQRVLTMSAEKTFGGDEEEM